MSIYGEKFARGVDLIFAHEGGYVDHPKDPGGATNMGITRATLSDWLGRPASKKGVKHMSRDTARAIYHHNYWVPINGDLLPEGVALSVFDMAVNAGVSRAAKLLQKIVGTREDGVIGRKTIDAVQSFDPAKLVNAYREIRLRYYKKLPTWGTFGAGWTRRANRTANTALSIIQSARNTAMGQGDKNGAVNDIFGVFVFDLIEDVLDNIVGDRAADLLADVAADAVGDALPTISDRASKMAKRIAARFSRWF